MVAKEIIDFQIQCEDPKDLPFFKMTTTAHRYVYFCRCFSPELGGQVVLYFEDSIGTVRRFMYLTGKLQFESDDILKFLDGKLGSAENADASDVDAIFDALNDYDGATQEELTESLAHLEPTHESEEVVQVEDLDLLLNFVFNTQKIGSIDSISKSFNRVVVFDGKQRMDFGSETNKGGNE